MADKIRKTIELPEITRIEGHAAVHVDIENGKVSSVQMEVFEGTRFFEQLVRGHKFHEMPHISSRVCAICSCGHVMAACFAIEAISGFKPSRRLRLFRELMHLGMIIESHASHIYALAMPDYLGVRDLVQFATEQKHYFEAWTKLRALGAAIQTTVGGRPFHPVNIQVGGLSRYPDAAALKALLPGIAEVDRLALEVAEYLLSSKPKVARTTTPAFVCLIPDEHEYGYFGDTVRCTEGWEAPVAEYKSYLQEHTVPYGHAKRTTARGKDMMVGSMARLLLFGDRLVGEARRIHEASALAAGDTNSAWNNLAQAIELIQALGRARQIIESLVTVHNHQEESQPAHRWQTAGTGTGAVECPRGTLYHSYELDAEGTVVSADMITPSVQNSGRIELDIHEVVESSPEPQQELLGEQLETLIRAYDPCNTCATHMVKVNFK